MSKKLNIGICVLFVLISFGSIFYTSQYKSGAEPRVKKLQKSIEEKEKRLSELKTLKVETQKSADVKLKSCAQAGNKIADLQTSYNSKVTGGQVDTEGIKKIAADLDVMLSEDSKNYRTPWYQPINSKGELNVQGKWIFRTNYSFSSETIPVLWTFNEEKTNDILAFVQGTYNVKDQTFSSISKNLTTKGHSYIGFEDPSVAQDKKLKEETKRIAEDAKKLEETKKAGVK